MQNLGSSPSKCTRIPGLFAAIFLDVFLLRNTAEVWIWKTQQAGQLIWDVVMIGGMFVALEQQGRLAFSALRVEDLGTLGITAGCGLVRALFLLDIGFGGVKGKAKET